MKHVESAHQQAYVARCRMHPIAKRVFAIPNGGKRNKITAAILKAEGVLAGVPDLCLPVHAGSCFGLWVEFKSPDGRLSKDQADYAGFLVAMGHVVLVVEEWRLAWDMTEKYLAGQLTPAMVVLR